MQFLPPSPTPPLAPWQKTAIRESRRREKANKTKKFPDETWKQSNINCEIESGRSLREHRSRFNRSKEGESFFAGWLTKRKERRKGETKREKKKKIPKNHGKSLRLPKSILRDDCARFKSHRLFSTLFTHTSCNNEIEIQLSETCAQTPAPTIRLCPSPEGERPREPS